jgi:hypothetical protein
MNRLRSILLCTAALAAALLGTEAIRSASTILWEPASTGLPLTGAVRDVAFGDVNNDRGLLRRDRAGHLHPRRPG